MPCLMANHTMRQDQRLDLHCQEIPLWPLFLYETLKLKDERGWKYWYARQTFGGGFTREPLKKNKHP
jgi:hypothetical protein